jgi:tetratricopeptide (TPR) repeat protein
MRPVGQSQVVENAFIVPVALIALVVAVYGLNIRPIEANRSLIEAISVQSQVSDLQPYADSFKRALNYSQGNLGTPEIREQLIAMSGELVNNNQPIPGKDDILTMTDQELKKQLAETPDDARYYVLYGSYLARANNLPEAEKQLIIATQKSPHKQSILFVLASVQIFEKKYADAEKTLQDAYESDPADQTAKLDYAASLIYTGKNDQAQSLLSTIDTATVVGNSDVMQALLATKQYQQIITYMKYNVDKNPSPQTYTYLASAYFYAHDKANAVATLKAGAAKFPEFKQNADGLIKQVLTSEPPQQ